MPRAVLVAIALFALTCSVYWQTRTFEFVNYDDQGYVTNQPELRRGFSAEGLRWALTLTHGGYMPLTGLTLLADAGLHGMEPGGYHVTNVLLHALVAALLCSFLWRTTGSLWASALVAALFTLHPLRVESVAWISSRKDLVCGLCWMITLHAYAGYAARPGIARYMLVMVGVTAAMLAKPMAVTLPCVLLLLDRWPLQRREAWHRRVLEKLPFAIPVIAVSVATFLIQRDSGAVSSAGHLPIGLRMANAIVAYALYLWKTIWPVDLVPLYPFPADGIPAIHIAASLAVLVAISAAAVYTARAAPWVLTGWLWYLGTLVPVIGLVQVGAQRMADRYMYLPQIGLFIIVVWTVRALAHWRPKLMPAAALVSTAALVASAVVAHRQAAHWRDSLTLWSHTVALTPDSVIARSSLGEAYMNREAWPDARRELLAALRISESHRPALLNLARVETRMGRYDDAILRCRVLVTQRRDDPDAHTAWAVANIHMREYNEALAHLDIALQADPNHPEALANAGAAFVLSNRPAAAIAPLEAALAQTPDDAVVLTNLGAAHFLLKNVSKARQFCDAALRVDPRYEQALALKRMIDELAP